VYGQRKESCEVKRDSIGDGMTCGCPHTCILCTHIVMYFNCYIVTENGIVISIY